jgi:hypothetical protein
MDAPRRAGAAVIAAAVLALAWAWPQPARPLGEPGYDALVARAIAEARAGRRDDAARTLDRAIRLEPRRPEARLERGGLRFLERRYEDALDDLDLAVRLRPRDEYARDLLASTLLLTGRYDPAIKQWNRLGKPVLGRLRVGGLRHAADADVRREITLREGSLLDVRAYRRSRLQLEESGLFEHVTLRPTVTEPGRADLDLDVLERHGFGPLPELAARGVVDLTRRKISLRYANIAGEPVTVGGEYKWESTQPSLGFTVALRRPLGFPGTIHLDALRARPSYDLEDGGGRFRLRTRGGGLRARTAVASRTVAEAGVRFRERTWDVTRADAPEGTIVGLLAGIEHIFWSGRRHDLAGSVGVTASPAALGSDVTFTRVLGCVVHHLHVQQPDGLPLEHGSIAAQAILGRGTGGTPLDEMFAPGAASEMELPLRAHRQKRGGVLGAAPIGATLALTNVEWRQRILRRPAFQLGYVLFHDMATVGRTARGGRETFHDVGVGLRLGLTGRVLLRADFGHSLTDGKNALTVGIGQVF